MLESKVIRFDIKASPYLFPMQKKTNLSCYLISAYVKLQKLFTGRMQRSCFFNESESRNKCYFFA